eukprot:g11675.t1
MQSEVPVSDYKTLFGPKMRSCFTGKSAVKWCMEREVCTDDIDAIHLLNRMLEIGLLHHCRLNKLVENSATAYYRFPQDHFKVLVDQTGVNQTARRRLRPNSKTLQGEKALQERWYADVPTLPIEKVRKIGRVLKQLSPKDITRGLRRHPMVFEGREAVKLFEESGVANNPTDALAIGNAFLRAGLFHQIQLRAPLRNDETLYRLAEHQFAILVSRDHVWGLYQGMSHWYGGHGGGGSGSMDDSRVGTVISNSDVLETRGESALELATSSRYWTSYRASKLYLLNLSVIKGFIDMSDDWDNHVDELFPTYCECYLTRDKDGTTHSTVRSHKTLHPVWNCPIAFRDVDYLDTIGIDLKAQTQLGQDILIGSLSFHAHEVMGKNNDIVVEFDCGSQQFADCAAAIIKVEFDPAVAVSVENPDSSKHHHLLTRGERRRERGEFMHAADMGRSRGPRYSNRRGSIRSSVRRTSLGATAEDMDPVFINVEGSSGCVLLDDDSTCPRRLDSFSSLPLGLMSSHGGSMTSSLHSLPVGPWQDPHASAGNGKRPSYSSSEARRGSTQSDLPDIHEDNEFHEQEPFQEPFREPVPRGAKNSNINEGDGGSNNSSAVGKDNGNTDNGGSSGISNGSQNGKEMEQQQQQGKESAAAVNGQAKARFGRGGGSGGGGGDGGDSPSTTPIDDNDNQTSHTKNNGSHNHTAANSSDRTDTGRTAAGRPMRNNTKSGAAILAPGPSRALHGGEAGKGLGGNMALTSRCGDANGPAAAAAAAAALSVRRRTSFDFDPTFLRNGEPGRDRVGGLAAAVGRGGAGGAASQRSGKAGPTAPAAGRAQRRLTWAASPTASSGAPPARTILRQ